jgi:superoxide dismutase, Fe-Mn family
MTRCPIYRFRKLRWGLRFIVLAGLALIVSQCGYGEKKSLFVQDPLPYSLDALEPYISAGTMTFHYGKHHAGYVTTANQLFGNSDIKGKTPEEIIRLTAGKKKDSALFNAAAQAWNHAFFWQCMKPNGGGAPTGKLLKHMEHSFGNFDTFKKAFLAAAQRHFGSGWVWLVQDGDKLKVVTTPNADTPLAHKLKPLFTVDLWEHAYYLDYQNRRLDFVEAILDNLANWDWAASQLEIETKTP